MSAGEEPRNTSATVASRLPEANPDIWYLRPDELSAQEIRRMGYILYSGLFSGNESTDLELGKIHLLARVRANDQFGERPKRFSTDAHVEFFALRYGLRSVVIRRWMQAAATEIAAA